MFGTSSPSAEVGVVVVGVSQELARALEVWRCRAMVIPPHGFGAIPDVGALDAWSDSIMMMMMMSEVEQSSKCGLFGGEIGSWRNRRNPNLRKKEESESPEAG